MARKLGISPLTSEIYLYEPTKDGIGSKNRTPIEKGEFIYCMVKYLEQNMGHDGITVITINGKPAHEILLKNLS